jgi:hypothetical protein
MKTSFITMFMQLQQQVRIFHWQTNHYARHQAYGGFYEDLDDLIDAFVEAYMGKYGRVRLGQQTGIVVKDMDQVDIPTFINDATQFLLGLTNQLDSTADTDLLNIRDEMLQLLNKLKYLLTLK